MSGLTAVEKKEIKRLFKDAMLLERGKSNYGYAYWAAVESRARELIETEADYGTLKSLNTREDTLSDADRYVKDLIAEKQQERG